MKNKHAFFSFSKVLVIYKFPFIYWTLEYIIHHKLPKFITTHFFFKLKVALFFVNFIYLFIYLWLCWVFVSVRGLSLVAPSGGHSSSRCAGLSLSWPLLLWSTGSRRAGSAIVAHGPSRSAACGIFPDQGSNPCPPHCQADSQPRRHQGSPIITHFILKIILHILHVQHNIKLTSNHLK